MGSEIKLILNAAEVGRVRLGEVNSRAPAALQAYGIEVFAAIAELRRRNVRPKTENKGAGEREEL